MQGDDTNEPLSSGARLQARVIRRPVAAFLSVFILSGLLLRSLQYFANPSLFVDEARLAVNVVDRNFADLLFKPLDFEQSAPPLFLLVTKLCGALFRYSEFGLRLPAFLAAVVALFVFAFLARRLENRVGLCVAVALFALSPTLVNYGAEIKQYSSDVLTVLILFLVTLNVHESEFGSRQTRIAVLCGLAAAWFSAACALAMPACCAALLVARPQRIRNRRFWLIAITWGVSALLAVFWARKVVTPHTLKYFNRGWGSAFFAFPPRSLEDLIAPVKIVRGLLWNQLNLWWVATPALALAVFGAFVYWRKGRREIATILAGPVVVALLASYARLYPFSGRLLLFMLPGLVLLLANGIDSVTDFVRRRLGTGMLAGYAALLIPAAFLVPPIERGIVDRPPWYNEELRDVLADIQSRQPRVEKFYVFVLSIPPMRYYAPRFGIPKSALIEGTSHRDSVSSYVADIRQVQKKSRLWLIFTHDDVAPEIRPGITKAFDSIGTRLDSVAYPEKPRGSGAKAYLYDTIPSRPLREGQR